LKKELKLFRSKAALFYFPDLGEGLAKPPALQRDHLALQNKSFFYFYFLWVIFAFQHLDPQTELNPDPVFHCRSTRLMSNAIPCLIMYTYVTGEEKTTVGSPH
jgi:hypothetical protein